MHNKFLVGFDGDTPMELLCGSANFTGGGLTSQANLVHTFHSPPLAKLYADRADFLKEDPTMGQAGKSARWSSPVTAGDAGLRVFFSPERKDERLSIDEAVDAIHSARSSVLFCLFTPTDDDLRNACFAVGDSGKMMFGLVNRIGEPPEDADEDRADVRANVALYHRSRENRDVFGKAWYENPPAGFFEEEELFPGERRPGFPPVLIHHKFIVIDGETSTPTIYSGSANMSNASLYNNDENLLEIKNSTRLAQIYVAEFFRLYEHYRARAIHQRNEDEGGPTDLKLAADASWAKDDFTPGDPKFRSRRAMSREP
jgi:phosphatidylserine/phosphatidylglycerophosphate/cardiolipin synthase-like enzyme